MEERILKALCEKGIEYITDENVAMRSTFKIGGVSALSVYPKSVCDICDAVKILKSAGVKYEMIGNASNMLFAFDRYNGALIFTSGINEYSIDGELVYASCGTSLVRLANAAKENSLSGLEFASGIPARIGGAIAMNAGAHGSQMSDIVEYTDAFDTESFEKIRLYDNGFGYRQSVFLKDKSLICLGAKLNLKKGESIAIAEKMKENNEKRRASQPLELPSAGSYFKRPENDFAGRLIEECGLKGERVGGAEVSPKHAGFIVNVGGASYHDVLSLEKKIMERVASRFGVMLCREVRLVED